MKLRKRKQYQKKSCDLPRKHEAIEALLLLAWRKGRKERPKWLIQEINSYC